MEQTSCSSALSYPQITTRCNMECAHCIFSCTEEGEDMSMETFNNWLNEAIDHGTSYITIGGGEPTLHDNFFNILAHCIIEFDDILVVTNGFDTDKTLKLFRVAEKCSNLYVAVSYDDFHYAQGKVVTDYIKHHRELYKEDSRISKRNTQNNLLYLGRAIDTLVADPSNDRCDCGGMVLPNGDVRFCSCLDSPIVGNVNTKKYLELTDEQCDALSERTCYKDVSDFIKK